MKALNGDVISELTDSKKCSSQVVRVTRWKAMGRRFDSQRKHIFSF